LIVVSNKHLIRPLFIPPNQNLQDETYQHVGFHIGGLWCHSCSSRWACKRRADYRIIHIHNSRNVSMGKPQFHPKFRRHSLISNHHPARSKASRNPRQPQLRRYTTARPDRRRPTRIRARFRTALQRLSEVRRRLPHSRPHRRHRSSRLCRSRLSRQWRHSVSLPHQWRRSRISECCRDFHFK
jgi:hypothetical protein